MNRALMLAIAAFAVAAALVVYIFVTGWDAPAAVQAGLQGVRDMVATPAAEPEADAEAPPAETAAPATTPAPRKPAAPVAVAEVEPAGTIDVAPLPAPAVAPPAAAVAPPPPPTPPRDPSAHYLPGNLSTWATFDIDLKEPLVVRAAGVVSSAASAASPDGVGLPVPAGPAPPGPPADQLVLADAPFLSLIGRVCSADRCTAPFSLGANATLCPADLPVRGQLQVLTNNYVRIGGRQTLSNYSTTTGGYSIYVQAAADGACTGTRAAALGRDATAMAEGRVLRNPDYHVSSGQTFWKPFFVPMGGPFVIRATGEIEASGPAPATGPNGATIPAEARWWSQQSGDATVTTRAGQLFREAFPYQALIGRLCGSDGCGEPFLVGRERMVCPADPYTDRVELWINRVIVAPRMLDRQTPLTFEMFELQTRRGGYSFEVAPAGANACR
jgi:hypothetical protein